MKVLKTYTGTYREQLAAYRADRCEIDPLFKADCEAVRTPFASQRKVSKNDPGD